MKLTSVVLVAVVVAAGVTHCVRAQENSADCRHWIDAVLELKEMSVKHRSKVNEVIHAQGSRAQQRIVKRALAYISAKERAGEAISLSDLALHCQDAFL